jgi:capsule biosynthesis phosphatase
MKYIVLCGGSGTRLETPNGFPKPFNMVLGVPSIQRVVESIPSDEIYVFLNKDLREIRAHTVLPHLSAKTFHCVYLDRYTRGAVETALVGLRQTSISPEEPICFFDNDTVYGACEIPPETAIGYMETTESRPYCYLTLGENNRVTDIAEKIRISNTYAAGVYAFRSREVFETSARSLLRDETSFNHEYYMSLLYRMLLDRGEPITGIPLKGCICLGTPEDIEANLNALPSKTLRICFDIDNTLFEYRSPGESYAQCRPIEPMIRFLTQLHAQGHTIILHTARGMKTHKSNLGEVIRAHALDTITRLEDYNVPYHELYFGKPHADLYIDDRAFNPYLHLHQTTGFTCLTVPSQSASNRYNTIVRSGDTITKRGPERSMMGEVFFYKTLHRTPLSSLFPSFLEGGPQLLKLRFVDGCTLFDLLRDKLLTPVHIQTMIRELQRMHSYEGIPITITKDDLYGNYMGKLKMRAQNTVDYPFETTQSVLATIDERMKSYSYTIVPVVHGDAWFSNTLLTKQGEIVFLDMKGDVNGILTTNGDALTDYGKLYQSLLGYDCILGGHPIDEAYMNTLRSAFFELLPFPRRDLNTVAACLIAKTISFLPPDVDPSIRYAIWNIVETCIQT